MAGRQRYWSLFVLMRKYGRHLSQVHTDQVDVKKKLDCVKELGRVLLERGKTLGSCGPPEVEAYKEYLIKKRYNGRSYSAKYQAMQLYKVRLFYDWARRDGLLRHHPLPDYTYCEGVREFLEKLPDKSPPRRYDIRIPERYQALVCEIEAYEKTLGLNPMTIRIHKRGWAQYLYYLETKKIEDLKTVTSRELLEYQRSLLEARDTRGWVLSSTERGKRLVSVKGLYKYLVKTGALPSDPTTVLDLPPYERGLPKVLLTSRELNRLMASPDTRTDLGLRDRAILEVMYSTGMRSGELAGLNVTDIDFKNGFVRVMEPKGGMNFQRVVPIGDVALDYLRRYLKKTRSVQKGEESEALVLNYKGRRLKKTYLYTLVKNCVFKAGIKKNITPHCFRVACATEMLRRRADIRYVQAQLGHRSLQSTQIYARVVPMDLKKVHRRTHPREAGRRRQKFAWAA